MTANILRKKHSINDEIHTGESDKRFGQKSRFVQFQTRHMESLKDIFNHYFNFAIYKIESTHLKIHNCKSSTFKISKFFNTRLNKSKF